MEYTKTEDQVVDIFTNALSCAKFDEFLTSLRMILRMTLRKSVTHLVIL